jgi:hypothetical protein
MTACGTAAGSDCNFTSFAFDPSLPTTYGHPLGADKSKGSTLIWAASASPGVLNRLQFIVEPTEPARPDAYRTGHTAGGDVAPPRRHAHAEQLGGFTLTVNLLRRQ